MQAKERERWEKARQKGMAAYILVNGILTYGLTMFVVMTVALRHARLPLWESAVLWLVAGAFFGVATWLVQEHRYRKSADTDQSAR
jgi:hypothetical protein